MKAAVDLLSDPKTPYEKIIIVRPAVEAEEKLGSLPGNVEEKLDPYIFPSYYLLNKIIGKEAREKFETNYLINQLKKNKNNISKTAEFIGMERSALHRKLKSLGIKDLN